MSVTSNYDFENCVLNLEGLKFSHLAFRLYMYSQIAIIGNILHHTEFFSPDSVVLLFVDMYIRLMLFFFLIPTLYTLVLFHMQLEKWG